MHIHSPHSLAWGQLTLHLQQHRNPRFRSQSTTDIFPTTAVLPLEGFLSAAHSVYSRAYLLPPRRHSHQNCTRLFQNNTCGKLTDVRHHRAVSSCKLLRSPCRLGFGQSMRSTLYLLVLNSSFRTTVGKFLKRGGGVNFQTPGAVAIFCNPT